MALSTIRRTTTGIRVVLVVASVLVLAVSVSLFLLPAQTDVYFAWTINPPLTAAFLGAGYLTSFLLEFLSSREPVWARARPAIPAVWAFTFLTLIVTLLHSDRFHFNSPRWITAAGTWVWLAVYVSVPIVMGLLWLQQLRQSGKDPLRLAPLSSWLRVLLLLQGASMLVVGCLMLVMPNVMIPIWPWALSPLTCRAIGAWGVGVGIIALQAAWENDWWRLFPTMLSYALYGVLQLVNVLRFPNSLAWERPSAFIYLVFAVSIAVTGVYGVRNSWQTYQMNERVAS